MTRNTGYAQRAQPHVEVCEDRGHCSKCKEIIHGPFFTSACPLNHKFCFHCVRGFYGHATARPEKWPPSCCKTPFVSAVGFISTFLSCRELENFCDRSMEMSTSSANRVYCSRKGCKMYLGNRQLNRGVIQCQACSAATCFNCKHPAPQRPAGPGILREPPFLQVNPGWQRCLDCGTIVQRISESRCAHMICGWNEDHCPYSGKTHWTGPVKVCNCRRFDGRLHRSPSQAQGFVDPLTMNPRRPYPMPSPIPGYEPRLYYRPNSYIPLTFESIKQRFPTVLPNKTVQQPVNRKALCYERMRWEIAPDATPEDGGEGAACLPAHLHDFKMSSSTAGSVISDRSSNPETLPFSPNTPESGSLGTPGVRGLLPPRGPLGIQTFRAPFFQPYIYRLPFGVHNYIPPFHPMGCPWSSWNPGPILPRTVKYELTPLIRAEEETPALDEDCGSVLGSESESASGDEGLPIESTDQAESAELDELTEQVPSFGATDIVAATGSDGRAESSSCPAADADDLDTETAMLVPHFAAEEYAPGLAHPNESIFNWNTDTIVLEPSLSAMGPPPSEGEIDMDKWNEEIQARNAGFQLDFSPKLCPARHNTPVSGESSNSDTESYNSDIETKF